MRTELSSTDIYLFIETSRELYQLVPQNMRPPATLGTDNLPDEKIDLCSGLCSRVRDDLSAKVTFSFVDKTKNSWGIDTKFSPQNESNWARIREISVCAEYSLYDQLAIWGEVVVPYSGDHRIRIKFGR